MAKEKFVQRNRNVRFWQDGNVGGRGKRGRRSVGRFRITTHSGTAATQRLPLDLSARIPMSQYILLQRIVHGRGCILGIQLY